MNQRISLQIKAGVADVQLNRVDKMNALDDQMFSALMETGERLKDEPGVRAVVISGAGRAFCAGLDRDHFGAMASPVPSAADYAPDHDPRLGLGRTPAGANRAQHAVMVWRDIPVPSSLRFTVSLLAADSN